MIRFFKSNNVFIPFKGYDFIGGPSTFMRNLSTYLDDVGYNYKSVVNVIDKWEIFKVS